MPALRALNENYQVELAVSKLVSRMSTRGVRLDMEKCYELRAYYEQEIASDMEKLAALGYADLNPKSPKQKLALFESLGFEGENRTRKKEDGTKKVTKSADKEALKKWQDKSPVASTLLRISEAQHQLNSFIVPFIETATLENGVYRLHPNFNSIGAATMRMSCSKPNLQNITADTSANHVTDIAFRARECFIPDEGYYWLGGDYKQIEIWLNFFLAKDKVGMKNLLNDVDMHTFMAEQCFGDEPDFQDNLAKYRKKAKIVNFSMPYGTGAEKLSIAIGCSIDEAKEYIRIYWDTYSGVSTLRKRLMAQVKSQGYVEDVFGYVYWPDPKLAYKALNFTVQGPAAGLIKRAMLNCEKVFQRLGYGETLLQIHDELMFQIPVDKPPPNELLCGAMQSDFHKVIGIPRPLGVDFCEYRENWGTKQIKQEEKQ
jgi:DNA polymerase I